MEDIVQRVFAIIFAVLVFFAMPLYMTFEKRDDISYALALKITSNFVNNVKSKGYLTAEMYSDFISELGATDNTYEVKLQHIAKEYNPVINVYDKDNKLIDVLDYEIYKDKYKEFQSGKMINVNGFNSNVDYSIKNGNKMEISYKMSNIYYNELQILDYLSQTGTSYFSLLDVEYKNISKAQIPYKPLNYTKKDGTPVYTMAVGDEFGVIIRNTNTTFATVLFDALTFNGISSDMPRVYINYGGVIKNEEYKISTEFNTEEKHKTR